MNRYEQLEMLERSAVRYLRETRVSPFAHRYCAEELAELLNSLARRWGCHYTVSVENLRNRTDNNPFGFMEP